MGYLFPPPHIALGPMLSVLLFYDNSNNNNNNSNNNNNIHNKLPLTAIKFIIIDGTIRFITTKYKHTYLIHYVPFEAASNETLTFYFRFEMLNIYYF